MRFNNFLLSLMAVWLWCLPVSAEFYQYRDQDGVLRFTDELSEVPTGLRPQVTIHPSVQKDNDSTLKNRQPFQQADAETLGEDMTEGEELPGSDESGGDQGDEGEAENAVDRPVAEDLTDDDQGMDEIQEIEEQAGAKAEAKIQEQMEAGEETMTDEPAEQALPVRNWRIKAREKQKEIDSRRQELSNRYKSIEQEKAKLGKPPAVDAPLEEKQAYNEKSIQLNEKIIQYQTDCLNLEKEVEDFNAQVSKKKRN
jgi:hypothetical protein